MSSRMSTPRFDACLGARYFRLLLGLGLVFVSVLAQTAVPGVNHKSKTRKVTMRVLSNELHSRLRR